MKRLALLALVLAAPAHAGQFCLSSQRSTDAAPFTFCQTVSDSEINAVAQAGAALLLPQGVLVTPASADGKTPAVYRAPTGQEITDAMGASVWTGWQVNATSYQRQQARAAADAAIAPVQ